MAPKLYMVDLSPPVRTVLLAAKAIGVELEHVQVNLMKQEHLTEEFLKVRSYLTQFHCILITIVFKLYK